MLVLRSGRPSYGVVAETLPSLASYRPVSLPSFQDLCVLRSSDTWDFDVDVVSLLWLPAYAAYAFTLISPLFTFTLPQAQICNLFTHEYFGEAVVSRTL